MNNHNASLQGLGYYYQAVSSLRLLLEKDDPEAAIGLEKLDDVYISIDDKNVEVIQEKHHSGPTDLSDYSVDVWKTLQSWFDFSQNNKYENVTFTMITTSTAVENSACYFMKNASRDEKTNNLIFEKLLYVAQNSENEANKKIYDTFTSNQDVFKKNLKSTVLFDKSPTISGEEERIKTIISRTSYPEFVDQIYERLLGWWYKKVIDFLQSDSLEIMKNGYLTYWLSELRDEYAKKNLPLSFEFKDGDADLNKLPNCGEVFIQQLKLIKVNDEIIKMAINDFYRAFMQKSRWINDRNILIEELDAHEEKLINEWKLKFYKEKDLMSLATEEEKVIFGKKLYYEMLDVQCKIREYFNELFLNRGMYQSLANDKKVFWHPDFLTRIASIMEGNEKDETMDGKK